MVKEENMKKGKVPSNKLLTNDSKYKKNKTLCVKIEGKKVN